MNRRSLVLLLAALVLVGAFGISPAWSDEKGAGVAFDLDGYYRVRYDNHFKTDWLYDDDSDWYSYFDQRMLLKPNLIINEKVRLVLELDILKNVNFGNNTDKRVPVVYVDRNATDLEMIESINFGQVDLPKGTIFSEQMSDHNVITGEEVDPIEIRRVYGEVKLPIGLLRVGRQGSHFGLGLFDNAGDGLDDDYGDTYDRLLFAFSPIGPYIPIFMYDKIIEDDHKIADTDAHQFRWENRVKDIQWGQDNQFDAGLAIMHRWQQSTDSKIFVYDLWFRFMFGGFRLESEALALQGQMTVFDRDTIRDFEQDGLPTGQRAGKITADAYLNANQFWYEADTWGSGVEFGFSSPSDPNSDKEFDAVAADNISEAAVLAAGDPNSAQASIEFVNAVVANQSAFGNHIYTYPFDRDYSVDLIMWEMLMGGAVKNGLYAKVGGYINPLDLMQIRLDLIKSWINESGKGRNGENADHDLGWELDLDFSVSAADHFTFGMQFGYAFPGAYFDDVYRNVENVFTFQSRFVFDF